MDPCLPGLSKYHTCIIFSRKLSPFGARIVELSENLFERLPSDGQSPGDICYSVASGTVVSLV